MSFGRSGTLILAFALLGCSSQESNAPDAAADASDDIDASPAICNFEQFQDAGGNGGACPMASPVLCFPECTTGGCTCRPGKNGKPVWECILDNSCFPECGPLDDCGAGTTGDGAGD
jgi:hypothetical protein